MRGRKLIQRLTAMVLSVIMVVGMMPVSALAETVSFPIDTSGEMTLAGDSGKDAFISLLSSETGIGTSMAHSPSEVSYPVRVSYSVGTVAACYEEVRTALITFTLSEECSADVSFNYRVLYGSADGYLIAQENDSGGTVIFHTGETEQTVEVPVKQLVNNPTATDYPQISRPDEFWNGDRVFFLYCSNIQNALFIDGEGNDQWELTIPVLIENDTDFDMLYTTATNYIIDLGADDSPISCGVVTGAAFEYALDTDENPMSTIRLSAYIAPDGAVRKLLDAGVLSHIGLPTGRFTSDESESGFVTFTMEIPESSSSSSRHLFSQEISLSGAETPFGLGEKALGYSGDAVPLGPEAEINSMVTELDLIFDLNGAVNAHVCFDSAEQLRFYDGAAPEVKSVTSLVGAVSLLGTVPIVVTFSEPVAAGGVILTLNDTTTLSPVESAETVSNRLSFLYKTALIYGGSVSYDVTGARDINGNEQTNDAGVPSGALSIPKADFDPERALIALASASVSLEQGTSENMSGTFTLTLGANIDLSNWLSAYINSEENHAVSVLQARVVDSDEMASDVTLYAEIQGGYVSKLTGAFTAPVNNTGADVSYVAELYFRVNSDGIYKLIYPLFAEYTVPPLTYVDEEVDLTLDYSNWPTGDSIAANAASLSLGYTLNVTPTWGGSEYFRWSSSNTDVAAINSAGVIALTGTSGKVSFMLTVSNPVNTGTVTKRSRELTVTAAADTYLSVPDALKKLEVTKGGDSIVSFSSNLTAKNAEYAKDATTETEFTVALYTADSSGGGALPVKIGETLYTETLGSTTAAPVTRLTLPASYLTNTTAAGVYGYIAELSARSLETGEALTAAVYICVRPQPAKAVLTRPDTLYITDDVFSFDFSYAVENYASGDTSFELTVRKNSETPTVYSVYSQRESFVIADLPEGRLLDAYTVSLKAKNGSDAAWSSDSFILYVYNAEAMGILINGKICSSYTFEPDSSFMDKTSDQLFMLRSQTQLNAMVSIDKTSYTWSNIADKIVWSVSGDGGLLLKYNDGGVLRDVDSGMLYLPGSDFVLEGQRSGSYTLTATHAQSGMEAETSVTVEPFFTKLVYLQIYPAVPCEVSYYTASGYRSIKVTDGKLAFYEPSGLTSDITIQPQSSLVYNDAAVSLDSLAANQSVWSTTGIFPINTVTLSTRSYKPTFLLAFHEKDAKYGYDGYFTIPYGGYVKVRAGIYVNDVLKGYARFTDGNLCTGEQIISTPLLKYEGYSSFTLDFDPETFAHGLSYADVVEFVAEIIPCGKDGTASDTLLPQIVRNTFWNRWNDLYFEPKESSFLPRGSSVISQYLTVDGAKKDPAEVLMLDKLPDYVFLTTELCVTDAENTDYTMDIIDETGAVVGRSVTSGKRLYPFAESVVVKSITNVTEAVKAQFGTSVLPGQILRLYPVLSKTDGSARYVFSTPLRLQNLMNIPSLSTLARSGGELDALKNTVIQTINMSKQPDDKGDGEMKKVLDYLSSMNLKGSTVGLEVNETDDPLVYVATFRMAIGSYKSSNPSGVFVGSGESSSFSATPGMSDMKAMSKGTFLTKSMQELKDSTKGMSSNKKVYGGGVLIEGMVFFDIDRQEWHFAPYQTTTCLGGGIVTSKTHNTWVGPVPVTMTFLFSGTVEGSLKTFTNLPDNGTAYITRLRPFVSIYGSGGVGFKYKGASLWAGPYGIVTHEQRYYWQKWNDTWTNGQMLKISGETGIELEASILWAEYHKKYKLAKSSKTWTHNNYSTINNNYESSAFQAASLLGAMNEDYVLIPVEEGSGYESRDYLTASDRFWESPFGRMRLFRASALTSVWTNAYPNAAPVLIEDGELMVYLSDMDSADLNDTRALFTLRNSDGSFNAGSAIGTDEAHPDSSLMAAGTKDSAAAVWVRGFHAIDTEAGGEITNEALLEMMTGAQIMASIYNGTNWTTAQLTDDERINLSPVVAASGGRAVAVWLSSTPGPLDSLFEYANSRIMYSVYDGFWSTPEVLLDAGTDVVSDLSAAILSDGRAAISYKLSVETASGEDDTDEGTSAETTVICSVLAESGIIVSTLKLSDSDVSNDGSQITSVKFPDDAMRFVVGWNTENALGTEVLRLAAVNADGTLYPDFSLELYDGSGYEGFVFSKGAETLDELSVIWSASDPSESSETDTYKAIVWGQKLTASETAYSAAARQKLLELDADKALRGFDCSVDSGSSFRFVLVTTEMDGESRIATLSRATASYKNYTISLEEPLFEYSEIRPGLDATLQFTATNEGLAPITGIAVNLGGTDYEFTGLSVASGESKTVTVICTVPDPVANIDYSITATFGSIGTDTKSGTLRLALPDVSIDRAQLLSAQNGERKFFVTLRSLTSSPLNTDTQSVRLQASASSDFSDLLYDEALTETELAQLNADGALSLNPSLSKDDLSGILVDGEIPAGGVWLYFRVVFEEEGLVLEDADTSNNYAFAQLKSLAEKNGTEISLASALTTEDGQSRIQIEAFNNNMTGIEDGNLIVSLLASDGSVLETRQTYISGDTDSLVRLNGETGTIKALSFTQAGAAADVRFERVGTMDAALTMNAVKTTLEVGAETDGQIVATANATGFSGNPNYTISSGTLPAGLSLNNSTGKITVSAATDLVVTPATTVTVKAEFGAQSATAAVIITVVSPSTPAITVRPTDLNFGNVRTGNTSSSFLIIRGSNLTGNIAYTISGDSSAFLLDASGWNAASGGTLQVTFQPTQAKNYTASIEFTSHGASPVTVTLAGSGYTNGGSSSDNSSPVIVTPPAPDKPNSPTQGEIKVPGIADGKDNINVNITVKIVMDAFDKALADARKNGNEQNGITVLLRVDTGGKTASNVTVNLSKAVQDTIIAKKIAGIVILVDNPDIKICMDLAAITEFNRQAKSDVKIIIARAGSGQLTGNAKKAIGNRPVFDLKVNYGSGKAVSSFGAGRVSVTIPYTLGTNENAGNVQAVYVDAKGKVHWLLNSVYDSVEKVLRFSTDHFSTYGIGYKQTNTAFKDIAGHWAKEDIEFVVSRGLFSGTSNTTFSPNTAMTRGMFVTALGRLANVDVSGYAKSSFTDVKNDAYYMGYIEWASKNNIVNEVGNGKFAPDQSITREQVATIMQNYVKVIGFTLPKVHTENIFADNVKISTYAKGAVKQMQMAGVISGKNGNLFDPQGTATRAEVSAVLRRFVELTISSDAMQGWTRNDSGQWMYYENGKPVIGKNEIGGTTYTFDQYGAAADVPKNLKYTIYIVQKGDNFWLIARKLGCTTSELERLNNKSRFSIIHPGDVLRVPEK